VLLQDYYVNIIRIFDQKDVFKWLENFNSDKIIKFNRKLRNCAIKKKNKDIKEFFYKIIDKVLLCKDKNIRNIKVLLRIKKFKDYENVLCVMQSDRALIIRELILHITKKREKAKMIVVFITITLTRIIT